MNENTSNCKPIVSRKFIKIGGTQFDVLLGDGTVKDLRDLETFHGEHIMSGVSCTTANLLNFLESWGSFDNTGSSVYIRTTNTVIPDSDTGIGDIPLNEALIITYRVGEQTLMWVHTKNGNVYKYRDYVWSVDNLNPSNYISINDVGTVVPGLDDNGLLDPSVLPLLPQEVIYGFDLSALQSLPNKDPNILYIDLNTRIQYYWNGTDFAPYTTLVNFANTSEAEEGIIIAKVMSPKTTKDAIEYHKSPLNVLGSSNLTNLSTNNTGTNTKVARQDHTHKITGFALTDHVHNRVLSRDINTGRIVDMGSRQVIDIDATTLGGWNRNNFATITQGNKADSAIQDVTVGGISYKSGTTATLPRYPVNSDFKLTLLNDFPENFVENKVLVTTVEGGFEFKDYTTSFNYSTSTNKPSVSIDAINPTILTSTPHILTGNLKLHPIVSYGTVDVLNDVNINTLEENNILQYKGGFWTNVPLESSLGNLSNLTFNNLGTGVTPNSSYNGSSSVIVSYNSIGAAPISHNHTLIGLADVLLTNLEEKDTLSYIGGKWINIPRYQISSLTFNNSGNGAVSGTVYNGNTPLPISYNTIGAAPGNHSHNIEDLTNVVISNPQQDQALVYNNGGWVNSAVGGGGGSITMFPYDIAFVHKDGYDAATARIGDINKPFANLQDAINAVVITNNLVSSIIYIMSDLFITEPIFLINNITITINLIDGVVVEYKNDNTPYTPYIPSPLTDEISNSLFNIHSSGKLIITSNGVGTFKCIEGFHGNSFATLGSTIFNYHYNATLELQNIIIEHIGTTIQLDGHSDGHLSTIICRYNSLLKINNCHILTFNTINADINCYNILLDHNNIVELNDSKLTILNTAYSGSSRHIYNIDRTTMISLFNCQTIQILKNQDLSTLTNWDVAVAGTEFNGVGESSHTISNCKFYIGNTIRNRNVDMVRVMSGSNHASVITIGTYDIIEYLGTSLHNYGENFSFSDTTPIQYGGLAGTSLIRCPLLQPYEINYVI